jgi:FMNH2-dependent dimethyl sulfone monooxygenase
MAARVSDWYFCNGNSIEGIKTQVDDIRRKSAEAGRRPPRIGMNAFIIARDTEDEAKKVLADIIKNADPEAVNAFGEAVKQAGKASPEGQGNWANSTFDDLVQYNDGFRPGLVGTPEQVAARIVEYKSAGVDLVLGGFLHYLEDVEYFGKRVLPIVRAIEAKQARAAA